MTLRERGPADAGPDAFPAFLRFLSLLLVAGFVVGCVQGVRLVQEHGYLKDGLQRMALLAATREGSRAIGWALGAGLIVGLPSLLYGFLRERSFGSAALLLAILPLHDLARRATIGDPDRVVRLFGPLARLAPEAARYDAALVALALLALIPLRLALRALAGARRARLAPLVSLAVVCALLPSLLHAGAARSGRPKGPNVLLITIDTLRADHLSAYGYPKPTSPCLDSLAARGVLFERAITPTPRTTQAIASMMTSLYPQTHGVRTLWGILGRGSLTLAELFRDAGFMTAGFWTTTFLDDKRGLSQGFDVYESTAQTSDRAELLTDRAIRWLARTFGSRRDGAGGGRRPFFLWLHYRDPHMPYNPPREERIFVDPTYRGVFREACVFWPTKEIMVYNHLGLIGPPDVAQAVALYDGEIRYVDREIRRLLRDLENRGILDKTLVIVTSDHGEGLSDHGYYFDHGDLLYDSSLQVPLILAGPGVPAARVREPVGLVDLAPTIAPLTGLAWPDTMEGRDLAPAIARAVGMTGHVSSDSASNAPPLFAESGENLLGPFNPHRYLQGVEGKLRSVRTERWKLILSPRPNGERGLELYDLAGDPAETTNVVTTQFAVASQLEKALDEFIAKDLEAEETELSDVDSETREKLRSMGYLSGAGPH